MEEWLINVIISFGTALVTTIATIITNHYIEDRKNKKKAIPQLKICKPNKTERYEELIVFINEIKDSLIEPDESNRGNCYICNKGEKVHIETIIVNGYLQIINKALYPNETIKILFNERYLRNVVEKPLEIDTVILELKDSMGVKHKYELPPRREGLKYEFTLKESIMK